MGAASVPAGRELLAFGTGGGLRPRPGRFVPERKLLALRAGALARQHPTTGRRLPVPVPAGVTRSRHGRPRERRVVLAHHRATQSNQLLVAGSEFRRRPSPPTRARASPGSGGRSRPSSSTVLWAVCPTGMLAEAFRSTDGGAQWSPLSSAGELENSAPPGARQRHGGRARARAARAAAADRATAAPPGRRSTPAANGAWSWTWIGFTDSNTGSALRSEANAPANWPWPNGPSPEQLWRSGDGGATWSGPVSFG